MPSQETLPRPSCVVCRERACLWGVDDRAHLCATCNRTVHSTSEDPRQPVRALLESTSTSMSSDSLYDVSVVPDIFHPDARNRNPPNPAQVRPERPALCDCLVFFPLQSPAVAHSRVGQSILHKICSALSQPRTIGSRTQCECAAGQTCRTSSISWRWSQLLHGARSRPRAASYLGHHQSGSRAALRKGGEHQEPENCLLSLCGLCRCVLTASCASAT